MKEQCINCFNKERKIRNWCISCYEKLRKNGSLVLLEKHTISNVDLDNKTGNCLVCGRVKVKVRKDRNIFECYTVVSKSDRRSVEKHYQKMSKISYSDLLNLQNGKCKICGKPPTEGEKLNYDHCHNTLTFRGLLCRNCNLGLGHFMDNQENLKKAILYLQENAPK